MSTALQWLHTLHGLNRALILIVGSAVLALLLLRTWRPTAAQATLPLLRGFVATLHLQVLLGVLLYLIQTGQHLPVFSGRGGWDHMLGGIAAAALGWLAWRQGRQGRPNLALLWCALALLVPAIKRPLETLALLAVFLLIGWLWPRQSKEA